MKPREQALLLLRKAAQDEALLDEVLASDQVSDEIIGFHCQQAAEKILKALLSDVWSPIPKDARDWRFKGSFGAGRSCTASTI